MDLSIIIPAKDEAESIGELIGEIQSVLTDEPRITEWEILFIDDGSSDDTWSVIEKLSQEYSEVEGFRFQYNCGKAAALALGFKEAKGYYIFTMDADLQDNPKEIPSFIDKLEEGYDLVSGWKKRRFDPWHKVLPSRIFNFVTSKAAGIRLHDFNCGFKAYKRDVLTFIKLYGDFHRYIPVWANWKGFKIDEIVVEHRKRKYGSSKYGLSRLVSGFLDLLTLLFIHKFSKKPLHFFGLLGLTFILAGSGVLGYFAIYWIIHQALHVRPLLVLGAVSLIIGIQFVSLGLLAEMQISRDDHTAFPLSDRTHKEG
ncbi:MAG: glycosyltransferase family 2 protein [Fibrobacterales bacterium]